MSNDYTPDLTPLAPGDVARANDVNERYENMVAAFDKLPAPAVGKQGFGAPVPVGSPVEDDHAVNKLWAETAMSSQLTQATAAAATATAQAGIATDQAGVAATKASEANDSAVAASTHAGTATTQAGIATAQAGIATTKAAEAADSESVATAKANEATTQAGIATGAADDATAQAGIATSQAAISTSAASAAANSSVLAQEWAEKAENAEITGSPGSYSAKHWASKAGASAAMAAAAAAMKHGFEKQHRDQRLFELSGGVLQTSQEATVSVGDAVVYLSGSTPVTLPALASHTDYLIYADQTGALTAQPWDDAAPANSREIGGFHAYHTDSTVNPNSLWDLGYRPTANPRGMTQCPTGDWVDIYLMDVDYGINGYSRGGVTIADGSSPPKIPTIYGGDGTTTYGSLTWFEAVDLAAAAGKRLLTYPVFTAAAYGVVERQAVGTDPVTTKYQAGHRSACGMEQATGCMWQWGEDINGTSATGTPSWQDITDGRGDVYTHSIRAVLLGADWSYASYSGSRASNWNAAPSNSGSYSSARASCGHMTL